MINRLLGMIYILMRKGTVTAAELAERFEVSVRTIYRDMDTLSAAGIPIYAKKGKNGGICLTEQFVLDKMLLMGATRTEIKVISSPRTSSRKSYPGWYRSGKPRRRMGKISCKSSGNFSAQIR